MSYKPLDRVTMRNSYNGQVTARVPGITSTLVSWKWDVGDAATIIEESAPNTGVYWLKFDKDPSVQLHISTSWFELLSEAKAPAAAVAPTKKDCVCKTLVLMAQGCICGHWKRYVEPHKRLVV